MRPSFDDSPLVEDQDLIRISYGTKPVRHHDTGAVVEEARESPLYARFGQRVDGAGGFVENENARIGQHGAGEADELTLAEADASAALADLGLKAGGHGLHDITAIEQLGGRDGLRWRGAVFAQHDVVKNRAGKKEVLLKHNTHLTMQPVAVELAYIVTVEKNLTAVRQIELGEQVDDGTLSASCVADKCNDPARRRREGYLVKYGSKGIIRERDVPEFNASLERGGENLVLKRYFHIGVAVDTPDGLVVPVIRDADRKGVYDLARELAEMSKLARDKKLKPGDMQGGTFSISSLGGIGGTAFTPIINAPEVAILGVSRAAMRPVWVGAKDGAGQFMPRLMLPLSLSYDHRVIDGAAAARFTSYLASVLSDIRRSLL